MQLYKGNVTDLVTHRGRETWTFLERLPTWRHDINVSYAAVLGLGAALVFTFAAPTQAADSIGQVPLRVLPPIAIPYEWAGAYVGGHVGYSRGSGRNTLLDPAASASSASFGSLFGGLQFGYNYLLPSHLLIGIEADISFPNFLDDGIVTSRTTPSSTVTEKLDFASTLRGRVGYAFDRLLVYGTGGFAWSEARFLEDPGLINNEDQVLRLRSGWAVGAGAELAIAPGWTARLEYLYDHFGHAGGVFPSGTGYKSTSIDLHSLRLGFNRKLDWPDAAPGPGNVDDPWAIDRNNWNVHGQFTFIEQGYPAFRSPYEGANSLSGASQAKNTVSATAFIGLRVSDNTEIYVNPEL